ncbi:MAG TPA: DUF6760 family protein [Bryocella sp.]|nr:DUF6760 family protein [Bryocella sp.]
MRCYPADRLRGEVAYIGYYLHWPYEQVMNMDHWERRQWVVEVSKINQRLNDAAKEAQGR